MMKEQEYRILHLEDLPSDASLAGYEIKKVLKNYSIRVVENEADFISELEGFKPHLVISDFQLPTFNGLSALKIVLEKSPQTPVIILTGSMNEDTAVECMKAGATDYVIKGHVKRLGNAVLNALEQRENIIEKKKAEQALLQSEENFHRSISESPLGIRIVSVDGKTVYANKAFLDIYEFSSLEDFINTPAKNRYTPECYLQHLERKEKRKNGEEVYDYELSIVRKNAAIRHIKVSRKEIRWDGVMHFQVINQDITEQKKLNIDLIAAKEKAEESDQLKTAFLHNISHEIRTPLNAIIGFSGFLNNADLSQEKREHFTNIIIQSSDHLLSIITDIITIATIEAGQEKIIEKEIDLNSVLKLLHEQFLLKAKNQNISLTLKPFSPGKEEKILSDETKLVQVLANLIGNAIKFTKKGYVNFGFNIVGSVETVETMHALSQQQKTIQFFVEDSGIGIPPEMHEEIFKRFRQVESTTTRQFGGSGLGLSISKAYVELLGGKIWLISELGKGSTFYFTIPYKKAQTLTIPEKQPIENIKFNNKPAKTLLIAEDENSNFLLLEELLSGLNIRIIKAVNGIEAVEICKSNKQIDLVLMDLKMPVLDGYEAIKQIKSFMPDMPIIAQTAYVEDLNIKKAFACGCTDIISKPISQELLLFKIGEQLYNE